MGGHFVRTKIKNDPSMVINDKNDDNELLLVIFYVTLRMHRDKIPGIITWAMHGLIKLLDSVKVQCFQLSDEIILVWACRKELSHQTL